jgi:hypothetical protein
MARPSKQQRLDIWMNGELVGHWKINAQGVQSFNYAETWFSSAALRPLSLSMPLQPPDIPYRQIVNSIIVLQSNRPVSVNTPNKKTMEVVNTPSF